jgi:hypothetical protein
MVFGLVLIAEVHALTNGGKPHLFGGLFIDSINITQKD